MPTKCDMCEGKGMREKYVRDKCPVCYGSGDIQVKWWYREGYRTDRCHICIGTGEVGEAQLKLIKCEKCHGKGSYLRWWESA